MPEAQLRTWLRLKYIKKGRCGKMTRWVMVIDLKKCIGCATCTTACKVENFLPAETLWNHNYDYEIGKYPNVTRHFLPVPCMHCQKPACAEVCPSGATVQRKDGIVYVDYDKCLGCGYCVVACPYKARSLAKEEKQYFKELTPYDKFPYELRAATQRHKVGVASKCTFCLHRIDEGLKKGLKPGVDEDATPACVIACIAAARYFGDADDPDSEVSKLLRTRETLQLHKELGTEPSVYYLLR